MYEGTLAVAAALLLDNPLVVAGGLGALLVVGILMFISSIKRFLYICPPNMVLIFSGGNYVMEDGSERGFRVKFGGLAFRKPIVEQASYMSLNIMEVPIRSRNAYSKGGIPLDVDAIANIKVSSDPLVVQNAIERFLGRDPEEIRRVAKETLEGHLRGVLATMTPEQVNEDRLEFSKSLAHESEEDLEKLGIHLDTLKIQHVADQVEYLDSIGREAIANVVRDAEIAESDAKRDAEQAEAQNIGLAKVATANVDAKVHQMKNTLRKIVADLDAQIRSEEEKTTAAARFARAEAEQDLQTVRREVENLRLQADEVLPAEANREAKEFISKGDAAYLREQGRAVGEVIEAWNQAWVDAGNDALSIHLIQELEAILTTVSTGVKKIKVDNLNIIDGGDGKTLSNYVGAYPAMIKSVFEAVSDTTGIDIPGIISGLSAEGNGQVRTKNPVLPRNTPVPTRSKS